MKIFRLFSIAAAALMMAACSSEDTAQNNNPVAGRQMHFTATIAAPNSGAGTRTEYTEDTENKKITVAWKVGDEIALVHDKVMDVVKVKTVNADGSATIDGTITSATDEATVQLVYPAARVSAVNSDGNLEFNETVSGKLLTQDGTLTYIQNNIDFRDGEGQLSVNGTEVTLNAAVDMVSSIAIWKLTLQDNAETPAAIKATQISVIKDGETPETLAGTSTLSTATSTVYLAMPPMSESEATVAIKAATADGTYIYENSGLTLEAGNYYQSTVTMAPAVTYLSELKENYIAQDGEVLKGTLGANVKISIAAGATVTLAGVTINGANSGDFKWAGITCEGDATIILKDGTENTVKGFYDEYPGIHPAVGKTLTIKGTGSLTASSNGKGAGIGGGYGIACGNIIIEGGTITATGGSNAAGIGSGSGETCSDITISGGTVTATGGSNAAGIGSGNNAGCGDIKITSGVTQVTATKGSSADNSIGKGRLGYCGTVTIGCTLNSDGSPIGGTTGAISTSPYTYPAPAATGHALSAAVVGDVVGSDGQAYDGTDYNNLPTGVTAVAKVCYVSGGHGLALALADESSAMDWSTAITTAAAHTPTVTGGTWKLATKDEWNNMITAAGGYTALRNGFTSVGGSNLDSDYYWSSTESNSSNAWMFLFSNGSWYEEFPKSMTILVRACLAF